MELRLNWRQVNPQAFQAMLELDKKVSGEFTDKVLLEYIKIRASQLNGCAFCLDMHTADLLRMGDYTQHIIQLSVWRESPLFTAKEKAVLELTEHVTKVADAGVPDEVYASVRAHLDEKEYVDLIMAILTINGWNRIAVASGMYPGCFDKE